MRVTVLAVGRLRAGPEADLVADYLARFDRTGRAVGLGPARVVEIDDRSGGGPPAEAARMARHIFPDSRLIALDERGQSMSSDDFATYLRQAADTGVRDMLIAIGGADGLADTVHDRADTALCFGRMVWPHMLVRAMLAEQLYRAAAILAGTPYHRA